MDGVHGVDVSWLHHHSNKEHLKSKKATSKVQAQPCDVPASTPSVSDGQPELNSATSYDEPSTSAPAQIGLSPTPSKSASKRSLLHRASSDKLAGIPSTNPEETRSSKRPGWISSLSSKFSSQTSTPTLGTSLSPNSKSKPTNTSSARTASKETPSAAADEANQAEAFEPYVPQQPKSGNFFSSAIRRLSSASQQSSPAKAGLQASPCARKVLNIDKGRERTRVKELDQKNLRRVAFSVDVEIVGVSRYADTDGPVDAATQAKDKRSQARSEGRALKHPQILEDQVQTLTASKDGGGRADSAGSVDDMFENEMLAAAKHQEREAARQRRADKKDKKQKGAETAKRHSNTDPGTGFTATPLNSSSVLQSPVDSNAPLTSLDRPTTDPLRMYRRCCQLREAPVLKRISEQLAKAKPDVEKTGIVESLDLNGSRLQLPDFVCLGDWLAIVPVRRLQLDNANLTDEGVRIVLAGLLAARPPDFAKRRRARSSPTRLQTRPLQRSSGVIEKISLRMNSKITSEGWRHICLFLNLSHSLKGIDLAMTPFPSTQSLVMRQGAKESTENPLSNPGDIAHVLSVALSTRSKESRLEELILSQCGLDTYTVSEVVVALKGSTISRLGIANNQLDHEALENIVLYVQSGSCLGLDLGGNDLRDATGILTKALTPECPLWALCLADCNLDPPSLSRLMPVLLPLSNFRFLDLSHNRELFAQTPNALGLLRRYLPQLKALRRVQLSDTNMLPEQAIAIAEVIPEIRNLNHVSFLDNPELSKLASASSPDEQEDSCAYYASLMWAVRLSKTMVAIDMNLPTSDTSEVIQALGKQIDAYLFRNIDRYTASGGITATDPYSVIPDTVDPEKEASIPDVLAHLAGQGEDVADEIGDGLTSRPDQDYIVGGTGVVKALSYVLSQKSADLRRGSGQVGGSLTPSHGTEREQEAGKVKAREMAKNMLRSARKIRSGLQVAMQKEQTQEDEYTLRRIQFLDHTLQSLILRFESEFPETAISKRPEILPVSVSMPFPFASITPSSPRPQSADATIEHGPEAVEPPAEDDGAERTAHSRSNSDASTEASSSVPNTVSGKLNRARPYSIDVSQLASLMNRADGDAPFPPPSRRTSTASLAAKAQVLEEGQMHRFGQRFRRDVLPPHGTDDHLHKTSSRDPAEPDHLQALRHRLEQVDSDELRNSVLEIGLEATVKRWGEDAEQIRRDSTPM